MKPTRVKLDNPPYHISKHLTHWTGRGKTEEEAFSILSKIIDSKELKFSVCPISPNRFEWKVTNEMICFTDTPIRQSFEHCKKYKSFGISFNKIKMMEYGANPVLYLVENRYKNQKFITDMGMKTLFEYNRHESLFSWVGSIFQPYDNGHSDYYEREWRILRLLPYPSLEEQIKQKGSFDEHPFKGKIRIEPINNPLPLEKRENFYLSFDFDVIDNIVVPPDYEGPAIDLLKRNNLECELIILEK